MTVLAAEFSHLQTNASLQSKQLDDYGMQSSMSGRRNCYDNGFVERFIGSLKYDWLANVTRLTREGIINGVNKYIRY